MMTEVQAILALASILVLFILGYVAGYEAAKFNIQKKAAKAGLGKYEADPHTGEVKWVWFAVVEGKLLGHDL